MSLKLQAILFDLDGTLLDTAPDFTGAINHIRQQDGLPIVAQAAIVDQISYGAGGIIQTLYDHLPDSAEYHSLRQRLLEQYEREVSVHTRLFPQLDELLGAIEKRALPWGVVTNKPVRFAEPLMQAQGLAERCQSLVCPEHVSHTKPHPEPMYLACEHMNVAPENCLYIGDHRRDILAGKAAGMQTIAAAYGYTHAADPPHQWQADYIAQHPADILGWLNQCNWSVACPSSLQSSVDV